MTRTTETTIEADRDVPIVRITREFAATREQLFRAHTDPVLFARWIGPDAGDTRIEHWDARTGGSWRFVSVHDGVEFAFHGCFHEVRPDRIVQTFTFEGEPDGVALETLWFDDLGDGRARLRTQSLVDSFESRDAWLASGMEGGVNEGYAKLERMIADGAV
ncbi:activator of HSP90 ATPase [Microbispora corallina]|uniref:Activator of HSP90 ATPase n=1 Tax=Microbispora corallina TaxID=83302 RepID=A0ABQ4G0J0_9ACTN|nr:SRPBCC family protein [Microbispora corallina]GIH40567.1 activator of HSP90 ATPase [Microbispora corallina]